MSMEEMMKKLLEKFESMENEVKEIKENMATKQDLEELATKQDLEKLATHEDVMRVADTLQSITDETAVSLQDKQEAGDVILKSMIDGLRNDMNQRFDGMQNTMIEGFNRIAKIMEIWVEKQKMVDTELRFHLQKIVNNEKATEELQRRVKELESGSGS